MCLNPWDEALAIPLHRPFSGDPLSLVLSTHDFIIPTNKLNNKRETGYGSWQCCHHQRCQPARRWHDPMLHCCFIAVYMPLLMPGLGVEAFCSCVTSEMTVRLYSNHVTFFVLYFCVVMLLQRFAQFFLCLVHYYRDYGRLYCILLVFFYDLCYFRFNVIWHFRGFTV